MSLSTEPGFSKSGAELNASETESPFTVQEKDEASAPPSVHAFTSPVSVSVTVRVSTAVVCSAMFGVVSEDVYVGVWSLTSVTVTAIVRSDGELPAASVTLTTTLQVLESELPPHPGVS